MNCKGTNAAKYAEGDTVAIDGMKIGVVEGVRFRPSGPVGQFVTEYRFSGARHSAEGWVAEGRLELVQSFTPFNWNEQS